MTYRTDHNAKAAYDVLQKRGVDFEELSAFKPDIQALLAEIKMRASTRKWKAKKAEVVVEDTGSDSTGKEDSDKQQD